MAKTENINLRGEILEAKPGATFLVKLENGSTVMAHLSGKIKMNFIKIVPGDKVQLDVSPYDLTKGRITRRD
jgi:translation initiation factor IF-1